LQKKRRKDDGLVAGVCMYCYGVKAERYYIEIERKMEVSINQIAKAIRRSQSPVLREIRRNTGQRGYRHKQANRLQESVILISPRQLSSLLRSNT
jgi:IS30 family transposase